MDFKSRLSYRILTVPVGVWLIIIGARLGTLGVMAIGKACFPPATYPSPTWMAEPGHPFRDTLANFDGAWFIRVAAIGYKKLQSGDYDLAAEKTRLRVMDEWGYNDGIKSFGYRHFPLFPYIMRIVHLAIDDWTTVGIVTANSFSLLFLLFIFKYAELEVGEKAAWWAVAFAALAPNAHYYLAIYSEGLFMATFLMSVYYARKNKWGLALVFGLITSASRLEGTFIFFALFLVLLNEVGNLKAVIRDKRLAIVFLAPLGILFPFLEYWRISGSPIAPYLAIKKAMGGATATTPWQALKLDFAHPNFLTFGIDLPTLLTMILITILLYRKVPKYLARFTVLEIMARLIQPHFGFVRLTIEFFAFHLYFGTLAEKRRALGTALLVFFAALLVFFAILFSLGYWVA